MWQFPVSVAPGRHSQADAGLTGAVPGYATAYYVVLRPECGVQYTVRNQHAMILVPLVSVAQAGRASVCGTEGRGFKSRRSPQIFQLVSGFASLAGCAIFAQSL
jgi:hypothetical protein